MVINPIVGVYIPIIRIPIKGGMTLAHMPPSYFKPKGFNEAAARSVVAAAFSGIEQGSQVAALGCGELCRDQGERVSIMDVWGKIMDGTSTTSPNLRNESSKAANGGSHSLNLA